MERPRGGLIARGKEVLVVGAGDAGAADPARDASARGARLHADRPVDDDPRKKNLRLHGVRVLGTTTTCRTCCASNSRTR